MSDESSNLGLQVVVRTLGGNQVDMKLIRFASGRNHHQSKQPMLVLFTDDGRQSTALESQGRSHSTVILLMGGDEREKALGNPGSPSPLHLFNIIIHHSLLTVRHNSQLSKET